MASMGPASTDASSMPPSGPTGSRGSEDADAKSKSFLAACGPASTDASSMPLSGPTGSRGSEDADAKSKSFLAACGWIGAAAACVILLIFGIKFFRNDSNPKATPNPDARPFDQTPLANKLQAGMECPSKQHGECMDDLVCIEAMKAVAERKDANSPIVLPAQHKGKFYCKPKVDVGGVCEPQKHEECVDHAVCVEHARVEGHWECKATLGASCTANNGDHYCWEPRFMLFGDGVISNCVNSECQVEAREGSCDFGKDVNYEAVEIGQNTVCKAGKGMPCGSQRGTAMNYCADGFKCVKDTNFAGFLGWKCELATNDATAQIQLGETTDTWLLTNASLSKTEAYAGKASNLRGKRTHSLDASALQLDAP